MRTRRLILLRQEAAAERWLHAKDIKIISGNVETPDALVYSIVAETGDDKAIREETGEDGVAVALIFVVQI
jgi:hypothetical protein